MTASSRRLELQDQRAVEKHCIRHGAWVSHLIARRGDQDVWTSCGKCEEERQRCDDWHFESGAEGRFMEATFDTFDVAGDERKARVLSACRDYVKTLQKDTWRPLWLIGPPGTGKTHLGAAMVEAVIYRRLMRGRIHSARQIIRKIRATWRKDSSESEDCVVADLARATLLVVDEVGVGFGSESELVHLLDVIDRRYQLRRPTVLISNLNLPAIQQALGDRIFDRLRENSSVLVCDWPSHRRPAEEVVQ